MKRIRSAVINLRPLEDGTRLLFTRRIAGVPLFKRLVFTLCRAGIEEIVVISKGLSEKERNTAESGIRTDSRFKGALTWYEHENFINGKGLEQLQNLAGDQGLLLAQANIVTTPKQIQNLLARWADIEPRDRKTPVSLSADPQCQEKIFIIPATQLDLVEKYLEHSGFQEPYEKLQPQERQNFCLEVRDINSLRQAEEKLLHQYKLHYTQLMDVWFNSLFSIPISSYLVKTPLTPNQLTLFGLVIGALAGWFFAGGNYLSGLFGGILLIFTAVWDCCDGDVARLKFMESDFGEYLDTLCDNIINVFIFIGIALGVGREHGALTAVIPFILLAIGGFSIYALIYYPKGSGKGEFFKGTKMYETVQLLASRNFVYTVLLFALFDRLDWFLWIAGFGANVFALALFFTRKKTPITDGNRLKM